MKKTMIVLFLIVCVMFNVARVQAQEYRIVVKPVNSNHWKYANLKGEIVIDKEFPVCNNFSSDGVGIVAFPKLNRYKLIDMQGEYLETEIEKFYLKDVFGYAAHNFSEGLIIIVEKKKFGMMNLAGQQVVESKYHNLQSINGGFAVGRIDKSYYIINLKGEEFEVQVPDLIDLKGFKQGLAPYRSKQKLWGFVNTKGEVVIKAYYKNVGYFVDGAAWARTVEGKIGYINLNGEWLIEPKFIAVKNFEAESGLARVKILDKWEYVNKEGIIVSFDICETVHDFSEGLAKGRVAEKWGFYNSEGHWVIEAQFQAVRDFNDGYAAARENNLWGIIDKKGNWVIQPTFYAIKDVVEINIKK